MVEGSPGGLAWSPTSDRLAYTITTPSAVQLWITDLATSASHQVKTSPLSESAHIAWTTHDELLFQLQGNHNYGVIAPGKPERLLFTGSDDDWAFAATPSPDGRHVAVRLNRATSSGMWVISLDDGTAKRVSTDGFLSPRGWTADGNWVLAVDGYFGNVLAVDATGGGRSRVALSPPPYSESIQLLPRDEGFAMIENQWRGDLWMVSLDDRRVAVSPALPPPRPLPLAMPALRNGAMSNGALGAAPTDWIPSGALDETVVTVDGCRGHDDRCVMLGQGGSIDQWIDPKPYLGQRVRLRARGRAETAGRIWVLAQTPSGFAPLASEPITSKEWTELGIAVDIRPDASAMLIRLSSEPTSRAWFDDIAVTPEH